MSEKQNIESIDIQSYINEFQALENCCLCPRNCGVNRLENSSGWCKTGNGFCIASVGPHFGEEPIISGVNGICNIFFTHCNLQCIFCQNYQISSNRIANEQYTVNFAALLRQLVNYLHAGCHAIGFVSPSHVVPQVKVIIRALRDLGEDCTFVYNSNAYDKEETLASLEGYIDVYLPDLKYMDAAVSQSYSATADYPDIATKAIREMYRQKGSRLLIDDKGQLTSGLIIRHLVLPGQLENSKNVLRFIAREVSRSVSVSLMSQYHPVYLAVEHQSLNRVISREEYREVMDEMERLGLYHGWIQSLDSPEIYLPDFEKDTPFE